MNVERNSELPEFREMGIAAAKLMRGVVHADDGEAWDIVLSHESELVDYFSKIGLRLVVDMSDGLAYLRQLSDDEMTPGYERIPRLFRRTSLGFDATLLCILLRDEYRRFEDEDLDQERCLIELDVLTDAWRTCMPPQEDDVRSRKRLMSALSKLEKLKFVRLAQRDGQTWEIRRILKSRLPLEQLETLRDQLKRLAAEASDSESGESNQQDG